MNEKLRIAVIAGTPVDTNMGVDIVKRSFCDAYTFPIAVSKNPIEQTEFQHLSQNEKIEYITPMLTEAINNGCDRLFIYCNSLSTAIDFHQLEERFGVFSVTPHDIYLNYGKRFKNIAVVAANNLSLSGIEKDIVESNRDTIVWGASLLGVVEAIERKERPDEIVKNFGLEHLMKYFEELKCEALIIGCTHFPYILEDVKKITKLEVIDPSEEMLKMIGK